MATKYTQATNTGTGFITHADQETDGLSFIGSPADVWAVTGTAAAVNAWLTRNSATVITKIAGQSLIDASLIGLVDDQGNPVTYTLA